MKGLDEGEEKHVPAGKARRAGEIAALFRGGMAAAKVGRRGEARRYFRTLLKLAPDHVHAWLWMAWLCEDPRESLFCLGQALELDPKNPQVRAGLRWARQRLERIKPPSKQPRQQERPGPAGAVSLLSALVRFTMLALALLALVLCCALAFTARPEQYVALAALWPTTPTLTLQGEGKGGWASPTPTFTPTPTCTPTPTSTPTPTFTPTPTPTPTAIPEKWIEIDLTRQKLIAYEGDKSVFEAKVSTGLKRTPTVTGEFRIYHKLRYADMAGPGYYLRSVPYTMYFYKSYAIHGTYWHNNFGQPMSHGCVNMKTEEAAWLYEWTDPPIPPGRLSARATKDSSGTLVVIHY